MTSFLTKVNRISVLSELEELTEPKFRYTFPKETLINAPTVDPGLYKTEFRGDLLVIQVDRFGEVRVARETPCKNVPKLALELRKQLEAS